MKKQHNFTEEKLEPYQAACSQRSIILAGSSRNRVKYSGQLCPSRAERQDNFGFTFTGPSFKSTVTCGLFSFQIVKSVLAPLKWLSKHGPLHCEAVESSHSVDIWLLLTELRSQEKNSSYSRTVSFLNLTYNEMIKINAIMKK